MFLCPPSRISSLCFPSPLPPPPPLYPPLAFPSEREMPNPHFPFLSPPSPPPPLALRFVSEARGDCTAGMEKKVRKKYCTKKRATKFRSKSAVHCTAKAFPARAVAKKKEANCRSTTTTTKQVPRSGTSRLQTVATAQKTCGGDVY